MNKGADTVSNGDPPQAILDEFNLTPEQLHRLTGRERSRLLNFLIRWDHFKALHACLDALTAANPNLVSLMDLRARALMAQGAHQPALEIMQTRLERSSSMTARALLARIYLARGDQNSARQVTQALIDQYSASPTIWGLLAQVELAAGDTAAALAARRRQSELSQQSRSYLLGMVDIYRAQNDWVTASGYAVRLLRTASEDSPLPIDYLRRLLKYFESSDEETRAEDVRAELDRRYQDELRAQQELLAPGTRRPRPSSQAAKTGQAAASAPPTLTLDQIPISQEERARITQAIQELFGFDTLLPGQAETFACVLRGEDVLTILPTGGGKSLCYQLPAMLDQEGTTLVISPLIALMKDQVDSLPDALRRKATAINSSLEGDELHRRLEGLAQGRYRLVYVAPERLRQPLFLHAARKSRLNRLVIDEAHCVSVWGHDFRPDYLYIGQVRQALGNPPLLGLTATAPPRVRRDIVNHLGELRIVAGDVTRPNLTLEVFYAHTADDKLAELIAFCQAARGPGIVYVDTRARSEELAALLRRYEISAAHYHAGIPNRAQVQDDFMSDRVRIVVATIAFGMGIDKPDIRFIVHFCPAKSLEAYYQEAGRAGRDGLPAHCLLMYAQGDRATLTRRSRRSLISTDLLRNTYGAVKRHLRGQPVGRVSQSDLERDLQQEGTRVRVALSLLEEAQLLKRGPDVPRTATIRTTHNAPTSDQTPSAAAFLAFAQAAHLRPGQPLDLDLLDTARQAGLPLSNIEQSVLKWADAGWLIYYASGRDMLLELPPAPPDAAQRVETLVERHATIQVQRVDEIAGYALARRCRHGHINAYLGGQSIERCPVCDNCIEIPSRADPGLPGEREQLHTILQCVTDARWGWGRATLIRILRGDIGNRRNSYSLRPEARAQAQFGLLAFRSQAAIGKLIDRLASGGFLRERRLDNGGVVLELAEAGQAAIKQPSSLDDLIPSPVPRPKPPLPKPAGQEPASQDEEQPEPDPALLEKLRAWRRALAKEQAVPPYVILHNSHLAAIAARRPTTLEALGQIKGVGPKRLEQYGEALLEIIGSHLDSESSST
jgi:ATP-dependent DNA helicase RecQ